MTTQWIPFSKDEWEMEEENSGGYSATDTKDRKDCKDINAINGLLDEASSDSMDNEVLNSHWFIQLMSWVWYMAIANWKIGLIIAIILMIYFGVGLHGYEIRAVGVIILLETLTLCVVGVGANIMQINRDSLGYFAIAVHLGVGLTSLATYMGNI